MIIRINLKLLLLAIVGTFYGYLIVDSFIIPISFTNFFLIEIVITLMHGLYSYTRSRIKSKLKS
jgi:hypothetical protein